jgi:hypothetical protein
MSRTLRLVMLATVASVVGACTQSPTGPAAPSQPTATAPKAVPTKVNADDVCDLINPWARC